MAPHPYRRGRVPRQDPQVNFPSGDVTAPAGPLSTASTLIIDTQAPSDTSGLDAPTLLVTETPAPTLLMSPTSTPAQVEADHGLGTPGIIGLSVGVFVFLMTILVVYIVLRNKKRAAVRDRQAKYMAWSKLNDDQKHKRSSEDSRTVNVGFETRPVPVMRPAPVLLPMTIPDASIPNPFIKSPISPNSPPQLFPRQYVYSQPVLTGTAQSFVHVPKVNEPLQRAISMAASSESEYENTVTGLSDVDTIRTKRRNNTESVVISEYFSEGTIASEYGTEYGTSVMSFIEPALYMSATSSLGPSRASSVSRKPVPSLDSLPSISPNGTTAPTPTPAPSPVPDFAPRAAHTNKLTKLAPLRTTKSTRARELRAMQALIDALDGDVIKSRRISPSSSRRTSRRTSNGGPKSRPVTAAEHAMARSGSNASSARISPISPSISNVSSSDFPLPPNSTTAEKQALNTQIQSGNGLPPASVFRTALGLSDNH